MSGTGGGDSFPPAEIFTDQEWRQLLGSDAPSSNPSHQPSHQQSHPVQRVSSFSQLLPHGSNPSQPSQQPQFQQFHPSQPSQQQSFQFSQPFQQFHPSQPSQQQSFQFSQPFQQGYAPPSTNYAMINYGFGNTSSLPSAQAVFDSRASQNYVPSASNAVHNVGYTPPSSNSGPSQHQQIQLNHQAVFDSRASQNYVPVSNAPSASNAVHTYAYRNPRLPAQSNYNVANRSRAIKVPGLSHEQKRKFNLAMADFGDLDSILAVKEYEKLFSNVEKSVLVARIQYLEKTASDTRSLTPWEVIRKNRKEQENLPKRHTPVFTVQRKRARRADSSSVPALGKEKLGKEREDALLVSSNDLRLMVKEEFHKAVKKDVTPKIDRILSILDTNSGD